MDKVDKVDKVTVYLVFFEVFSGESPNNAGGFAANQPPPLRFDYSAGGLGYVHGLTPIVLSINKHLIYVISKENVEERVVGVQPTFWKLVRIKRPLAMLR